MWWMKPLAEESHHCMFFQMKSHSSRKIYINPRRVLGFSWNWKWHKNVFWRHNIYLQNYCNPHSVHKSSAWNINKTCWHICVCFITFEWLLARIWKQFTMTSREHTSNNTLACAHTYSLQQYMIYISDMSRTQPGAAAAFVDSVRIYRFRMTPVEHRHKGSLNVVFQNSVIEGLLLVFVENKSPFSGEFISAFCTQWNKPK